MQIKELELENFKSFKHQKFTFNKGITAITGPNGSGKSNIFDALIFVLGNNSSNRLRYKKISDLICKDQKEKYATVRLTFDDNTTIERTISEDVSVFRLNGKRTTQEAVISFLKELKISPEGHNLVQQGNNKKIIDMNDQERKKQIEDICQVSLFDEQREKSEKNLDFVRNKISQAKTIMEERKSILENLEKEKAIAEEYLKVKDNEIILKGIILKKEKQLQEHDLQKTQKRIETLNKNIPEEQRKVNELSSYIKDLENDLDSQKKDYRSFLEEKSKFDAESKVYDYKLNTINNVLSEILNSKHNAESKLNAISLNTENIDLLNYESEISDLKSKLAKYDVKSLERMQMDSNKKMQAIESKISEKNIILYDLKAKQSLKESEEKKFTQNKSKLEDIETRINAIKNKHYSLDKDKNELSLLLDKKESISEELNNTNKSILNAQEKILQNNYKIDTILKEIELLKNAKNITNDLIVINNEKEADKLIEDSIKKNIFGTFFFVLHNKLNDVKSNIIIKTISSSDKISELESEIEKLKSKKESLNTDLLEFKQTLFELNKQMDLISEELNSKQDLIAKYTLNNKNIESELRFLNEKKLELSELVNSKFESEDYDIDSIESELLELNEEKQKIPKVDFDDYLKLSQEYNSKLENYQKLKEQKKQKEIEYELAKKEHNAITLFLKDLANNLSVKNKELDALKNEMQSFNKMKLDYETKLKEHDSKVFECEQKLKSITQEKLDSNTRINVWNQELDELKTNIFLKEESLSKKIEEIKKYIEINTSIDIQKLEIEFTNNQGIPIKDLQNNYYDLLNKLNAFGNVNLKSIEDYAEYQEKYGTILQRIDELELEMQEIKNKIKEIQAEKEEKFLKSFEIINKNFVDTLGKLGLGDLSLYIEKNDLDEISGVSIKSSKRGTISLSGGEKAMVTISFLFAVLMLEPSVFYLLDEIDADLDYNNSERVFTMLNDIAINTQMLMVTHNPVIVNKADSVIGVSKNAHGVTTIFVKQDHQEVSELGS